MSKLLLKKKDKPDLPAFKPSFQHDIYGLILIRYELDLKALLLNTNADVAEYRFFV